MESTYIITFIGDDRPGLVEELAKVIETQGGNWHESQLSQLGGKFAGLISVSLAQESGAQLEEALKALSSSGLSVRVTPTVAGKVVSGPQNISLEVIGPDRLGIVREISSALASCHVNVVNMDSKVNSAPMSGEMLFSANISAEIDGKTDLEVLSENLDNIANQMDIDISLQQG